MYRQSEKNLLSSNTSSTRPDNMVNFGILTAEICWRVWGTPTNFNGFCVLPSLLQRRRSPEANETLQDVWPSPALLHYIYIFGGSCTLTEFWPVQNSVYVQVLRSRILAALPHGTPAAAADISQTLRCGTRNGITELSQRTPPIFGRAAITLGIGPHSSYQLFYSVVNDLFEKIAEFSIRVSYFGIADVVQIYSLFCYRNLNVVSGIRPICIL